MRHRPVHGLLRIRGKMSQIPVCAEKTLLLCGLARIRIALQGGVQHIMPNHARASLDAVRNLACACKRRKDPDLPRRDILRTRRLQLHRLERIQKRLRHCGRCCFCPGLQTQLSTSVVPCVPQNGATAVGLGKRDSVFGLRVPQLDHNGQSCVVCVGCVEPVPDGWEVGRDHPLGVLRV